MDRRVLSSRVEFIPNCSPQGAPGPTTTCTTQSDVCSVCRRVDFCMVPVCVWHPIHDSHSPHTAGGFGRGRVGAGTAETVGVLRRPTAAAAAAATGVVDGEGFFAAVPNGRINAGSAFDSSMGFNVDESAATLLLPANGDMEDAPPMRSVPPPA